MRVRVPRLPPFLARRSVSRKPLQKVFCSRVQLPRGPPFFRLRPIAVDWAGFVNRKVSRLHAGSTPAVGSIYGRCIHRGRGRCLLNSWVGESRLGIVLSSFRHLRGCRLHLRTPTFPLETWPTRNHQPLHFGGLGNGQSPTLRTSFSVGSSPTAPATFHRTVA